mmetsp:Transcript_10294/g.23843  ORF Transcript_10294/g.23843 Transcript_10294/m.23843 type:complete len:172 (-) Transcript_10294:1845-2360(-)
MCATSVDWPHSPNSRRPRMHARPMPPAEAEAEAGAPEDQNEFVYSYLLWVPQLAGYQELTQTFNRFPDSHYPWNTVDQLIVSPLDALDPLTMRLKNTKYKRLLFAILPPPAPSALRSPSEWLDAHFASRHDQDRDSFSSRSFSVAAGAAAAGRIGRPSSRRSGCFGWRMCG